MKNKLLSLIPEFLGIKDEELREKSVTTWLGAMKKGGWDTAGLLEMPFTLLIENAPVNIIEHTRAVTLCSLKIADVMLEEYGDRVSINRNYLLSGALLHDVGKLFEYEKDGEKFVKSREGRLLRHPISGAAFAYEQGLPLEVVHIIAAHSRDGDGARKTVEAVIINHADFVNFESLKI